MNQNKIALSLVSVFLLFFFVPDVFAQKEQEAISSFEKRVAIFEKFFKSEPLLIEKQDFRKASPKGIIFFYVKFTNCKISYDIVKTDSLISPLMGYILLSYISVESTKCGDVKSFDDKYFSTIESLKNNKNNKSCYKESVKHTVKFIFAYQNSKWVFKEVLNTYNNKPAAWLVPVFTGRNSNDRYYVEDNDFWKVLLQ